nr:hypothetical protein [Tanacetum cinerariifolium]
MIHTILQCLIAKTTAWNEFSNTMASAINCLADNQKFNFSKYISHNMVKILERGVKFCLFLRFLLQEQVFDLQEAKEIAALKKKVTKLTKWRKLRSKRIRRLKKFGSGRIVKSPLKKDGLGAQEDESKQGRMIEEIDQNGEITLDDETQERTNDDEMFGSVKPKVVVQEQEMSTTIPTFATTVTTAVPTPRAKARLSRAQQDEEANNSWDNIQAMIDADRLLAERLQVREKEEFSEVQKARLLVELIEKRKKHFVALRDQEKRNKPPTKTQMKSQMSTYLKHMGGNKQSHLKGRRFDKIKKLFDREMRKVNDFVAMDLEAQESSTKRTAKQLESDICKKQKVDENVEPVIDDSEELKKCMEIVPDDEDEIQEGETVDDMDNLLFGNLKTMFEHHVKDTIWTYQQGLAKPSRIKFCKRNQGKTFKAGSRDHPPMLATGRYPQWRSRFLRYIDTRPNAIPEHTTVETPMNISPAYKAHFESEKEVIHLILTGIGDKIYSTVDACQTAQEMWEAIERLQQGESLNIQDPEWLRFVMIVKQQHKLDEVSYHKLFDILKQYHKEVNELRAEILAKNANPLALVATAQANQDPYYQTPKDKDMQKNLALIEKYFKRIYKPTNNNLRTSSNSRNKNVDTTSQYKNDNQSGQFGNQKTVNVAGARKNAGSPVVYQSGIQCFNCKEFGHFAKECKNLKRVKDSAYHKEKMLLCKQAEKGVPLQAEQYNWLEDTDEEIDEQELEAHYSYIAKIQKNDQNDVESHDERVALANLIANLKLDADENKKIQKQIKKANTTLAQELKECKTILAKTSKTLGESISVRDSCLVALQNKQTEFEKYKAFNDHTVNYDKLEMVKEKHDELIKQSLLTKSHYEGLVKQKTKSQPIQTIHMMAPKVPTYNGRPTFANPRYLKQAQSEIPCLYALPYDQSTRANRLIPDAKETLALERDSRSKLNKDLVRPYDYTTLNSVYENFKPLTQEFEIQLAHANEIRKKIKSRQAYNVMKNNINHFKEIVDNAWIKHSKDQFHLKAQLQDKNIAISELKKLIEKGKGKSVKTKFDKPSVVRQPNAQRILKPSILGVNHKTNVSRQQHRSNQLKDKVLPNNSQLKLKKTQVEEHPRIPSIPNKMKSVTTCNDSLNSRTLNVNVVCATCKKCLVDSDHFACVTKMLNDVNARTKKPNVVPISTRKPKGHTNKSVTTPHKKKVASKSTNQKPQSYYRMLYEKTSKTWKWWIELQSPSEYKWIVQLIIFIVDSGCTKHMTGNLKLLCNFVEKFLGTVRFGNDQFAPVLGYGDLVQGNIMINRVYYVEGLNHNLFSVELTSSTPLCLMAKASPTQARLWHRRLSHLNFDYINLLSKKDIVIGLPKLKFVKDQLCSFCELSKVKRSAFKSNVVPSSKRRLNLLHMDLCGPMRVASINGKKYILVIVDDYSRYTWTLFLCSKDETPEVLKEFLTMIQRNLQALVITVRTDRGTQDGENLDKMREKRDLCILVGYSNQSKGYCVYNKRTRLIVESIHIRFDEIKEISEMSVANDTSGLVPQRQKASDYGNSDPENNNNQAEEEHLQEDEFTNLFCVPAQEVDESSSHNIDNLNVHTFNQPQVSEYRWTKDHPLQQVHGNPLRPVQTRQQLATDPEMYMFALTVSTAEPKNIKEAMTNSAWIEAMQEELHQFDRLQEEGIDFEELFAPVARLEAVQISSHMQHINGFVDPDHPEKVYRLRKALYGLKQAPRAWYDELSKFLTSKGFTKDADHAGCIDTRKSTSRGIQFLCDKLVSWMSKKQDCTAMSSAEAEYVALSATCAQRHSRGFPGDMSLGIGFPGDKSPRKSRWGSLVRDSFPGDNPRRKDADHAVCHFDRKTESEYVAVSGCCAQVLWMRTQLTDYGFFYEKVPSYCDSKSAIEISCNPVQHTRTKHIDVRTEVDLPRSLPSHLRKLGLGDGV